MSVTDQLRSDLVDLAVQCGLAVAGFDAWGNEEGWANVDPEERPAMVELFERRKRKVYMLTDLIRDSMNGMADQMRVLADERPNSKNPV